MLEFENDLQIEEYCEELISKYEINNYYIIKDVEKLRTVLNEIFEETLGTDGYKKTEIRPVKLNNKIICIVSNNCVDFENIN